MDRETIGGDATHAPMSDASVTAAQAQLRAVHVASVRRNGPPLSDTSMVPTWLLPSQPPTTHSASPMRPTHAPRRGIESARELCWVVLPFDETTTVSPTLLEALRTFEYTISQQRIHAHHSLRQQQRPRPLPFKPTKSSHIKHFTCNLRTVITCYRHLYACGMCASNKR